MRCRQGVGSGVGKFAYTTTWLGRVFLLSRVPLFAFSRYFVCLPFGIRQGRNVMVYRYCSDNYALCYGWKQDLIVFSQL